MIGAALSFTGSFIFLTAVVTMKDSWRAGIVENAKTKMITASFADPAKRNLSAKGIWK